MQRATEHTKEIEVFANQARFYLPNDADIIFSLRLAENKAAGKFYIFCDTELVHSGRFIDDSPLPYEFNCAKISKSRVFVIFRFIHNPPTRPNVTVAYRKIVCETDSQRETLQADDAQSILKLALD
jgi:hypothetical protein